MDVLVYANKRCLDGAVEVFAAPLGHEDRIAPRNAAAHKRGQVEPADRVHVDDRYPLVAEDYRASDGFSGTVELFDANELDAPEPPDAEGPSEGLDPDAFASPTAHDAAVEAGLGPADLDAVEPRGKTGYTTAQIRELAD